MAKRSLNLTIRIDQETLDILDALRGRERLRASRAEYIRMLIRYAKRRMRVVLVRHPLPFLR